MNPDITTATMAQTICNTRWTTKRIRPPTAYTNKLKRELMRTMGYTVVNPLPCLKPSTGGRCFSYDLTKCVQRSGNSACWELDHYDAITNGGEPGGYGSDQAHRDTVREARGRRNLWLEAWYLNVGGLEQGAKEKDKVEVRLHAAICGGQLPLELRDWGPTHDWRQLYLELIGSFPKSKTALTPLTH